MAMTQGGGVMQDLLGRLAGAGAGEIAEIGVLPFVVLLTVSLLSSFFISFLYSKFFEKRATGTQIHRSFPLLGVSITTIFICIQFSLPLSLGLLGALSIVRFRTPVKEPEEIGFIMVIIGTSICCATFNLVFLGLLLVAVVVALLILQATGGRFGFADGQGSVAVTMKTDAYRENSSKLLELFRARLPKGQLDGISSLESDTTLTYTFHRTTPENLTALEAAISSLAPGAKTTIFFHRPGGL